MDVLTNLENIFNKDTLRLNLSHIALFVGMYENFIDIVLERVESFFCDDFESDKDGKFKYKHNEKYRTFIKNRRVDEFWNKDKLKSSMLWLVDSGAITMEEYTIFLELKGRRDRYVHVMSECIWVGLDETDSIAFMRLFELFCKTDNWWINEIEIPLIGDEIEPDYDPEGVQSFSLAAFKCMINVLYAGKSELYTEELRKFKSFFEDNK